MTEVTSGPRVTIRDIRAARLCSGGSRKWCAAHDIPWSDVLGDGVPVQTLIDTGDPIVARVVKACLDASARR